nr:cyclophilin-like fold protein [Kribbella sp. VKM Ac-2527]
MLLFDDRAVPATLDDMPATRELAARLPLTMDFRDTWGQAKSARLPGPVPVIGVARTLEPTPGGIYYWPDTATLAVYYDDLGQSVPPPGLVRLGTLDGDPAEIADVGHQVAVRIDWAVKSRS